MSKDNRNAQLSDVYDFHYGMGNTIENIGGDYPIYGSNGAVGFTNVYNSENAPVIGHISAYAGIVNWARGKHFVTYNGVICRIKKGINPRFGYYLLLHSKLQKRLRGSTQPFISYDLLNDVRVFLPERIIQDNIAAVLSALDSKIELNNRINTELETMAKMLYDYWFVQFDFPDKNGKPYKSSGGKMVWNAELKREIPIGWNVRRLDSEINILNGYAFKSDDYSKEGIFVLRTKNFSSNGVVSFLSDDVYLPQGFRETHAQYLCQPYDYHLVMVGASVGNRGIIYQHHLPALRNQNMWCFRAKLKSLYGKSYIKYLVNFIVKEKAKYSSGSARDFFTKDNFNSHLYCQPEDSILKRFEELCFPILQRQANVDHENQELSSLRDWLLPMLMNGQVRVG